MKKLRASVRYDRTLLILSALVAASCRDNSKSPSREIAQNGHGREDGSGTGNGPPALGGDSSSSPDGSSAVADSGPGKVDYVVGYDPESAMMPVTRGEVIGEAPANTTLPALPRLINVQATAVGDSASISFDPVDGALDYRVYELPAPDAVSTSDDGHVTIKNAVYRCAGNRQAPLATMDGATQVAGGAIRTLVDGQDVEGYTRSLGEAVLGYVYAEPGPGRIPVYALGDNRPNADNPCYFQRWSASRLKQYVTSDSERETLLSKGFRDDGIAFYVPEAASGATTQIFTRVSSTNSRQYFSAGPEANARKDESPAFFALDAPADGSVPLMRVYYANACGLAHDELVAGKARFELARRQGDGFPLTKLHWSGLKGPTTLVIEALDAGCPFQGLIAPQAVPGFTSKDTSVTYQSWVTPEALKSSLANQELFINGQFDGTNPRAVARSFVRLSPAEAPSLDWSYGFKANDTLGEFSSIPCGAADGNCWGAVRMVSNAVDTSFYSLEVERRAQGPLFGQWWVMYADYAADTNGKYRMTPKVKADLTADSYLYVSMEVDAFSTGRRYPQILISDRDTPVQDHLKDGNTLILQTFSDWPNRYELQVCDHRNWDVNDQCPRFDFYYQRPADDPAATTALAPIPEVGEQVGMDQANLFEIYVSSTHAYVFLDRKPFGCATLPTTGVPTGSVTVTFGDVLYHSGVDNLYDYTKRRWRVETSRRFDNLGFKSHVPAPPWNASRFPCTPHLKAN